MARFEFKLPDIGEGVTEGEVVGWLVKPGDVVTDDQPMVEVMTDKATVTISAPKAGKVVELCAKAGEIVKVHSVLVVFELDGGAGMATDQGAPATASAPPAKTNGHAATSSNGTAKPGEGNGGPKKDEGPAATAVGDIREDLPGMRLAPQPSATSRAAAAPAPSSAYFNEKPLATPATRKLARDLGVDLRTVPPSGPNGRVTKDDVRGVTNGAPTHAPAPTAPLETHAPTAAIELTPPAAAMELTPPAAARAPMRITPPAGATVALEERIPLKGVRKKIFENMARSKQTAAHFTFVEECDVTALKALRERLKPAAAAQGIKLSFLPFIVKAIVAALKKHPMLNAAFDEATQEIVVRKYYNVGIAASTDAGLMVPVVKDADRRSILDLAREIQRLGEDAKSGKVKLDDLQGSTFTITSLGQQGGLFATPIVNFPEVAILGVHQMKEKPVVRDGQIVIGEVMLLSLSFDHRIIDGHVGAAFAYEVIGYLENPDKLFLEMA